MRTSGVPPSDFVVARPGGLRAPGPPDIAAHGIFITLILIGLFTTKDCVIKTVIPATFILNCAYIALLFVQLSG